jgi:hypothetical protein
LGNELLGEDSAALEVIREVARDNRYDILHVDPTENIPLDDLDPLFVDVVIGIHTVTIFSSLNSFKKPPTITLHDYDLYDELQLLLKTKKINSFTVIGVPVKGDVKDAVVQIQEYLSRMTHS